MGIEWVDVGKLFNGNYSEVVIWVVMKIWLVVL